MDFNFLFYDLQYLLLAVLVLPLVSAAAVWGAGRSGPHAARRTAAWAAAVHLILTVSLAFLAGSVLAERVRTGDTGRFDPIAVVGDPGLASGEGESRSLTHATSWT